MANTQALRRRVRSVRSTQQITKAMKMVAASPLTRASHTSAPRRLPRRGR